MLPAMRSVQAALHAQENLFAEQACAHRIARQAGNVACHGWLIAGDERAERPIRSQARVRRQPQFWFVFGVYVGCGACKHILPGHKRHPFLNQKSKRERTALEPLEPIESINSIAPTIPAVPAVPTKTSRRVSIK